MKWRQCMKGHEKTWKLSEVNFYVYAWPFIHCLYFIEARKVYLLTHLKITTVEIHLYPFMFLTVKVIHFGSFQFIELFKSVFDQITSQVELKAVKKYLVRS